MSNHSHGIFDRQDFEDIWVNHYQFLLSRGYRLRPRYEPGWIGSWKQNGKDPSMCEDSLSNFLWNVIDAVRIADNVKVVLKLVPTDTEQIPIALYLSSEHLLSDPRNRCVRILDYVPLPADDEQGLLVMPFLREFDDPPFEFRGECIEVVGQLLKGLQFMHEHNVTHRDACNGNIMMDTTRLIPSGFHHVATNTYDGIGYRRNLSCKTRLSVQPVYYYFIDFGLSTRFPSFESRTLVLGKYGQDKTVPELSKTVPYDPFKVDIYQLGGVIKELVETYHGLRLLRALANAMIHSDPTKRPTASEALSRFEKIVSKLGPQKLNARIIQYKHWFPAKILLSLGIRKGLDPYSLDYPIKMHSSS